MDTSKELTVQQGARGPNAEEVLQTKEAPYSVVLVGKDTAPEVVGELHSINPVFRSYLGLARVTGKAFVAIVTTPETRKTVPIPFSVNDPENLPSLLSDVLMFLGEQRASWLVVAPREDRKIVFDFLERVAPGGKA